MTIKEQFYQLKKANNLEALEKFRKKYRMLFILNANILCKEIVEGIKSESPKIKANPVYQVSGNLYTLQKLPEKEQLNQTISTSIAIKNGSQFTYINLAEKSSANNENDLKSGSYPIDIFSILMNDKIEHASLVHSACWKAISKNLKEQIINEKEI